MMITPNLNDGESYVEGRSEATARKLFEAAEKAGIDTARISTSSHGYVVPSELVGKLDSEDTEDKTAEAEDQPAVPTEPGTTTDPKEAWNAEAGQVREEELADKNVDEGAEALVAPVEEAQADAEKRETADGDFDPADHTVEEVKEYLETADDKERDRVIAAEEASEKPRRGILKLADEEEEGDK